MCIYIYCTAPGIENIRWQKKYWGHTCWYLSVGEKSVWLRLKFCLQRNWQISGMTGRKIFFRVDFILIPPSPKFPLEIPFEQKSSGGLPRCCKVNTVQPVLVRNKNLIPVFFLKTHIEANTVQEVQIKNWLWKLFLFSCKICGKTCTKKIKFYTDLPRPTVHVAI